jgi:hypothetical protein
MTFFGAQQGDDCHSLLKMSIAESSPKMLDIIKREEEILLRVSI